MKFLLDESAELRIAAFLKEAGHDVTTITEDYQMSTPDPEVLKIANSEKRILITNDKDFGELIVKKKLPHNGVIFFRLPLDSSAIEKIKWLKKILIEYINQLDKFLTVKRSGIRVRA